MVLLMDLRFWTALHKAFQKLEEASMRHSEEFAKTGRVPRELALAVLRAMDLVSPSPMLIIVASFKTVPHLFSEACVHEGNS